MAFKTERFKQRGQGLDLRLGKIAFGCRSNDELTRVSSEAFVLPSARDESAWPSRVTVGGVGHDGIIGVSFIEWLLCARLCVKPFTAISFFIL